MDNDKSEEAMRNRKRLNVSSDSIFRECATTLCRSTLHWSFGKADRFSQPKSAHSAEYCVLPSTLNKRSAGFGYGGRSPMVNRQGGDSPSPNRYNLKSVFDSINPHAPSFGGPYLNIKSSVDKSPGPGAYEVLNPLGNDAPKFTLKGKIETKIRASSPPPTAYNPSPVRSGRFAGIGLGLGDRSFLNNRSLSTNPGPGSYETHSPFNIAKPSISQSKWGSRMTAVTRARDNISL